MKTSSVSAKLVAPGGVWTKYKIWIKHSFHLPPLSTYLHLSIFSPISIKQWLFFKTRNIAPPLTLHHHPRSNLPVSLSGMFMVLLVNRVCDCFVYKWFCRAIGEDYQRTRKSCLARNIHVSLSHRWLKAWWETLCSLLFFFLSLFSWVLFIHICIGFLFLFLISSILNCMEFEIIESAQKLTLLFSSFKLWVLLLFFPGKPNSLIKFLYLFVSIFSLHCQ